MARAIDGDALIEWFSPYLHTGEPIPADVVIADIRSIPTLTPPNEWVSVEERLPEPTYCALVYTTDYSIEVDAIGSDGEWMSFEVTHWMPLPAPPDRRPLEGEEDTR